MAVLDKRFFSISGFELGSALATLDDDNFALAVVEIKTRVAAITLGTSNALYSADLILFDVGDEKFRKYISREFIEQIMHQLVVLSLNLALYLQAAQIRILYIVIVRCSDAVRSTCQDALTRGGGAMVSRARCAECGSPQVC